jgi:hypothetical protein
MEHSNELGYTSSKNPSGCRIWSDPNATNEMVHGMLVSYSVDLEGYNDIIRNFAPIPDTMDGIRAGNYDVCSAARLHPEGLVGLFPSDQLSLTTSGYVEPLMPPMRSHKFCANKRAELLSLDYLVHDFYAMCRSLKPTSRRVFFDLGASLKFHRSDSPVMSLLSQYERFGFRFDHIYAFEMKFTEPKDVYEKLLPEKYFPAYHWINVGEKVHRLHLFICFDPTSTCRS